MKFREKMGGVQMIFCKAQMCNSYEILSTDLQKKNKILSFLVKRKEW